MKQSTVLVGRDSHRIIDKEEPVVFFPTLDSIYVHISNNGTLSALFPTEKAFLGYLSLVMSTYSEMEALEALEAIAEHLFENCMDFESDAEQFLWHEISEETFSKTIFLNFKELSKQFERKISRK